jgi:hypothetical protein
MPSSLAQIREGILFRVMITSDYTELINEAHQLARPLQPSELCSAGSTKSRGWPSFPAPKTLAPSTLTATRL